jgi:hypothetical protein
MGGVKPMGFDRLSPNGFGSHFQIRARNIYGHFQAKMAEKTHGYCVVSQKMLGTEQFE